MFGHNLYMLGQPVEQIWNSPSNEPGKSLQFESTYAYVSSTGRGHKSYKVMCPTYPISNVPNLPTNPFLEIGSRNLTWCPNWLFRPNQKSQKSRLEAFCSGQMWATFWLNHGSRPDFKGADLYLQFQAHIL